MKSCMHAHVLLVWRSLTAQDWPKDLASIVMVAFLHSCTKRGVRLFMKRNETFKTCVLNAFSVKRCI
jgi:hypothetical protein